MLDLDAVMERVVNLVQETFDYHHVGIFTIDRDSSMVVMRDRAGVYENLFPADHQLGLGEGMVGCVAQHGKTRLSNDVELEPHYVNLYPDVIPTHSELSVPIQAGNVVVGVLDVQSPHKHAFDENDVLVIETLADQVAVAMDNARLYQAAEQELNERRRAEEALQRYSERLRTLRTIDGAILAAWSPEDIARSALRHIRQLVPCRQASVVMIEDERECRVLATVASGETQIGAGTRYTPEPSALKRLRQGKVNVKEDVLSLPQHLPIVQALRAGGVRSYVSVPLIAQGELIGFLNLGAQSAGAFSSEHIDIASEVANQIAVGLSQARLHEQIERHVEELEQRVAERTADLSVANAELSRAARLKDEFLAAMSHELRTPLNAILGLSEALQEEIYGSLTERQTKSLRTIETSGRHLLALINDILDVSKIGAGKLKLTIGPVAVESVCRASLGLVKQDAHKKRLKVSSSFDSAVTIVQVDMRRLKQILVNLLSNAVKFTPEGGAIGLEVVGDAEREVVHFTVWDTGIGIAPEEMERLFKPFVQLDSSLSRKHVGTGLGLVLVHRMTEMHGGGVSVESEVGKGSRFTVSLPWQQEGGRRTRKQGDKGARGQVDEGKDRPSPARPTTILLAEDNEASIQTSADYLRVSGYRVIVARNGVEAVERALEEKPDLILMDIQMPEMDGLEATRRIRAASPLSPPTGGRKGGDVPIVALTALAMPNDRERCLEAGANEYLSKPVGLRELVRVIEKQLRS